MRRRRKPPPGSFPGNNGGAAETGFAADMRKIISRPDPMTLPKLGLPVHVRSVGYNEAECGWFEYAPGERKQFVHLIKHFRMTLTGLRDYPEAIITKGGVNVKEIDPGTMESKLVKGLYFACYYWITFDGPRAADLMKSYDYPRTGFYAGECPVKLFAEIELQLKQRTPYAQRHAVSVAAEILALAGEQPGGPMDNDLVKRFIGLAHDRFQDPCVTVGMLAGELGVHRTTLNRVFFRSMSISPSAYLDQIRIQRALSLLRETEQPVKEIAYSCGFHHPSYFCSVIRRNTGMTPAGYRRHSGLD